ncbi:DNA polymerase IV [Peptoniphilus sp.]|uniref:DNA polymerase IV n=1 Tax=Peptoniphilus sp. TaxID=1971214 RepID=UPI003D8BFDC1
MRTIMHVDIDAFYASVEELDDPTIIGKPVVVGGKSDHAIVTTANYEARKYGIHSAMPMFMAKNLCDHLIIKPMRRARYLEKSKEVFDVLKTFTDKIEKVSIDESYLDITGLGYGIDAPRRLQKKVFEETGLTVSVGLSYNKFLTKLASDWNKPNGIKIIKPEDVPEILLPLDINKVHGIGKQSEKKLKSLGINTVSDLYELPESFLSELFKKKGKEIYDRIRGIDNREVEVGVLRKSLGTETTFEITSSREVLKNHLKDFAEEISEDLIYKEISGYTLTLKLKNENFVTKTRSKTYATPIYESEDIFEKGVEIFNEVYEGDKIRLIGLTVSNLEDIKIEQLKFLT